MTSLEEKELKVSEYDQEIPQSQSENVTFANRYQAALYVFSSLAPIFLRKRKLVALP